MIPVHWLNGARGFWDHGLLMHLFTGQLWPTRTDFDERGDIANGGILVIPGQHVVDQVDEIESTLRSMPWSIVFLVSDEEARFPWRRLADIPGCVLYVQTPHPTVTFSVTVRPIVDGFRYDTRDTIRAITTDPPTKSQVWGFSGQITNATRRKFFEVFKDTPHGEINGTDGFGKGLGYEEYLGILLRSWIAPSPSGPSTPDCFRTWEALECGAVPIVDDHAPDKTGPVGYHDRLGRGVTRGGERPPFVKSEGWGDGSTEIVKSVNENPRLGRRLATKAQAWWIGYKRSLAHEIEDTLPERPEPSDLDLSDRLTVLMPTSPIPAHPSSDMIRQTIRRIRSYPELSRCEIVILCDGVHESLEHRRSDYEEYLRQLVWHCNHDPEMFGCLPVIFDRHTHQATMTRFALEEIVRTPALTFIEHDTWPCGDIEWAGILKTVLERDVVVRFYHHSHEERIHPQHKHLLVDGHPVDVGNGIIGYRTKQWSQRPHVATTDYYNRMMDRHFHVDDVCMIEDIVHGPVANEPWSRHRVVVYAPDGNIKRSDTCDGRKSDPKIEIAHRAKRGR